MKLFHIAAVLALLGSLAYATGGNVQGTPTGQAQSGTSNTVSKYQSNGQLGNSSISDNGAAVATAEAAVVGAASASGGTLVVKSTSTTAGNPILSLVNNSGTETAADYQNGQRGLNSRTLAQAQTDVPVKTGVEIFCSNCVPPKVLVATGTAAGNWADPAGAVFK